MVTRKLCFHKFFMLFYGGQKFLAKKDAHEYSLGQITLLFLNMYEMLIMGDNR